MAARDDAHITRTAADLPGELGRPGGHFVDVREYETRLGDALDEAGFDREAPDLRLAWEVFRRLLPEPIDDDLGASVEGLVTTDLLSERCDRVFRLRFVREACAETSSWPVISLVINLRPANALASRAFSVTQRIGDTDRLIGLKEFLDRCDANENFAAVLGHKGDWTAGILSEDFGT
jgi:hypothetical protein